MQRVRITTDGRIGRIIHIGMQVMPNALTQAGVVVPSDKQEQPGQSINFALWAVIAIEDTPDYVVTPLQLTEPLWDE